MSQGRALFEIASGQQRLNVLVAAHQNAFDKHHGECRPTCPQFQRIAFSPVAEVTSIFQIMVLNIGIGQSFLNGFANRVLAHADHHHAVLPHGGHHFFDDFPVVVGNQRLYGRVNLRFVQNVSWHRSS